MEGQLPPIERLANLPVGAPANLPPLGPSGSGGGAGPSSMESEVSAVELIHENDFKYPTTLDEATALIRKYTLALEKQRDVIGRISADDASRPIRLRNIDMVGRFLEEAIRQRNMLDPSSVAREERVEGFEIAKPTFTFDPSAGAGEPVDLGEGTEGVVGLEGLEGSGSSGVLRPVVAPSQSSVTPIGAPIPPPIVSTPPPSQPIVTPTPVAAPSQTRGARRRRTGGVIPSPQISGDMDGDGGGQSTLVRDANMVVLSQAQGRISFSVDERKAIRELFRKSGFADEPFLQFVDRMSRIAAMDNALTKRKLDLDKRESELDTKKQKQELDLAAVRHNQKNEISIAKSRAKAEIDIAKREQAEQATVAKAAADLALLKLKTNAVECAAWDRYYKNNRSSNSETEADFRLRRTVTPARKKILDKLTISQKIPMNNLTPYDFVTHALVEFSEWYALFDTFKKHDEPSMAMFRMNIQRELLGDPSRTKTLEGSLNLWEKWYNTERSGDEGRVAFRKRIDAYPTQLIESLVFANNGGVRVSAGSAPAKKTLTELVNMRPPIAKLKQRLIARDKEIADATKILRGYLAKNLHSFQTSANRGEGAGEITMGESEDEEGGGEITMGESEDEESEDEDEEQKSGLTILLDQFGKTLKAGDPAKTIFSQLQIVLKEKNLTITSLQKEIESLRSRGFGVDKDEYNRLSAELVSTRKALTDERKLLADAQKQIIALSGELEKSRATVGVLQVEKAPTFSSLEQLESLKKSLTFQTKRSEDSERQLREVGDELTKLRDENREVNAKNMIATTKLLSASVGVDPESRDLVRHLRSVYNEILSEKRISVCAPRFKFFPEFVTFAPLTVLGIKRIGVFDVSDMAFEVIAYDIHGNQYLSNGAQSLFDPSEENESARTLQVTRSPSKESVFPAGSHVLIRLHAGRRTDLTKREGKSAPIEFSMRYRYSTDLVSLSWTTFQLGLPASDVVQREFKTKNPLLFRTRGINFNVGAVVEISNVSNVPGFKQDFVSRVVLTIQR